jgi:site-specific DNA-methyltransferase (adenine-specific)
MYNIFNSDSLEGLMGIDDETVDLVLLDPPYFDYKTSHRKDKEDKLSQSLVQQSQEEQIETIRQAIRVLKQDRAFYIFTNWSNIYWMQAPLTTFLRNMIIWDKGNWTAGDLKGSFGNQYEVILLGCKGKWEYTGKRESDIWFIPRVGTNRIHSTEKPVDLYKKIIENSTRPGELVLDAYVGSGASMIASLELGRNFIGWEIDPEYYKRVTERVDRYCLDKALERGG